MLVVDDKVANDWSCDQSCEGKEIWYVVDLFTALYWRIQLQ